MNLVRTPGLHPFSYSKDILGFLMTTKAPSVALKGSALMLLRFRYLGI